MAGEPGRLLGEAQRAGAVRADIDLDAIVSAVLALDDQHRAKRIMILVDGLHAIHHR
jgi:hypothetical protein